jgi:hypothetical protein
MFMATSFDLLDQGSPNYGLRAACSPPYTFIQPVKKINKLKNGGFTLVFASTYLCEKKL